jgi:uncharacterized membrane protein
MIKKTINLIKENIFVAILAGFIAINFFVALRLNIFRYNNFDFGKFDQGNMTQMVWNTLQGRVLYLTDYFGSNVPRWSMSHVDPILLLFVPVFAVFPHPMTLAYAQLALMVLSAFLVYEITRMELKSKLAACLFGMAYLLYPSMGFINGTMGFHGVTAAVPFFLAAFYLFERMYKENNFSTKRTIIFWILLVITMSGKEQIPLYIIMWGIFILLFRTNAGEGASLKFRLDTLWFSKFFKLKPARLGAEMIVSGIIWFVVAFFIIIPKYASVRTESYRKFVESINVTFVSTNDVTLSNYFLSRYGDFGTSYKEVVINMLLNPRKAIRAFLSGDKIDNLNRTFAPVSYLPIANPFMLMISAPEFAINYMTTSSGVGTEEIENHRISMIIPVLFISSIYAVSFIASLFGGIFPKYKNLNKYIVVVISGIVLVSCLKTTSDYNNPLYLWFNQAIKKRVFAKYDQELIKNSDLKVGTVVKLPDLDVKDNACANAIINMIPDKASVSGPDNLGTQLSMRETYAIYPSLWNSADYVIVDVLSRKLLTILQLNANIVRDVTKNVITNKDYKLVLGCGNLFLFQKGPTQDKLEPYPIQERYDYNVKYDFVFTDTLKVVDFTLPLKVTRGVNTKNTIVYQRLDSGALDGFVLYMTYVNKQDQSIYQVANLPSFAFNRPVDWIKERYYVENIDVALPSYLKTGNYQVFVSLSNKILYRSLYLGDLIVE